jgi:hypothetical protein
MNVSDKFTRRSTRFKEVLGNSLRNTEHSGGYHLPATRGSGNCVSHNFKGSGKHSLNKGGFGAVLIELEELR